MSPEILDIPGKGGLALITYRSADKVFREDKELSGLPVGEYLYMPWGADNQMPYRILELIDRDGTMSACQDVSSELCYAGGLKFDVSATPLHVRESVDTFTLDCDLGQLFMGLCTDFRYWNFAVVVFCVVGGRIVSVERREPLYCRFEKSDDSGRIRHIFYADWRRGTPASIDEVEVLPLLSPDGTFSDLSERAKMQDGRFAMVCRMPKADSTYYPIPGYGSLFLDKWYDIKQLISIAKEAKLRNSAPIKYHIEISEHYWEQLFDIRGITGIDDQRKVMTEEKKNIIDFVTGAENSGKVWFSQFYVTPDGRETHDIRITRIEGSKEGGDWSTDIQEAVNMICFVMRVHPNLVGSVPGKSQSNNSGSDKRELFTIGQAMQRPYHDILLRPFRILCRFNRWSGVVPEIPIIQLTTLDKHKDVETSTL